MSNTETTQWLVPAQEPGDRSTWVPFGVSLLAL